MVVLAFGWGLSHSRPTEPRTPRSILWGFASKFEAVLLLPDKYRAEALAALGRAGENAGQLAQALRLTDPAEREGLGFLLANMPDSDLRTLSARFLAEHVNLAYQARRSLPLAGGVPDEIFLNDVLPYSVVNERRENWRKEFFALFGPLAARSPTIEDAVVDINLGLILHYRLTYRERDNRKRVLSPFESLAAGSVSCGEASLLLVAACRSVGIPARLIVLPLWAHVPAGHIWVEVYDRGQWRHLVAFDVSRLDRTWMEPHFVALNPANPAQRIYASSFKKTNIHVTYGPSVSFTDITDGYRAGK